LLDVQTIPILTLPSVPFTDRRGLPKCAAIYFVLNDQGAVLYIGSSIELAKRWYGHHRIAVLMTHDAARIAWLVIDNVTALRKVEAACIAYFEPVCNGCVTPQATRRRDLQAAQARREQNLQAAQARREQYMQDRQEKVRWAMLSRLVRSL
jgi:excinuclease UvrABC nuclease subunit